MRQALAILPTEINGDLASVGVLIDLDDIEGGTYNYLTALIGDTLDYVSFSADLGAYIDDEGKLKGLPVNPLATVFYQSLRYTTDYIVGPALLVGAADEDGNETGLPEVWVNRILAHAGTLADDSPRYCLAGCGYRLPDEYAETEAICGACLDAEGLS